ncbi:hypothetical protein BH11BAC7_BH11BAC7_02030 [soil metagenome]
MKIISFTLGCFFILLMAIASNSKWMGTCEKYFPNPYRYGDLYLLSSMPGFRTKDDVAFVSPPRAKNNNITLTIIGDSYVEGFVPENFSAGEYRFIPWGEIPHKVQPLDGSKRNILILESTERNVRWRFISQDILSIGTNAPRAEESGSNVHLAAEDNLQFMLTHLEWQLPFKEAKTKIYLDCFGKFSTMVDKPDGSGRLYLNETVDTASGSSSFARINDDEINRIVGWLNTECATLQAMGFDEVYVSFIPNASSLYKKTSFPYNHLIERIEDSPQAQFKTIDVYKTFKTKKESLYQVNDSHWNGSGKKIWWMKIDSLLNNQ